MATLAHYKMSGNAADSYASNSGVAFGVEWVSSPLFGTDGEGVFKDAGARLEAGVQYSGGDSAGVSIWFRAQSGSSVLFSQHDGQRGLMLEVTPAGGLRMTVGDTVGEVVPIWRGGYHHAVLSYGDGAAVLYLDGLEVASLESPIEWPDLSAFIKGGEPAGDTDSLRVAGVAFFDQALTLNNARALNLFVDEIELEVEVSTGVPVGVYTGGSNDKVEAVLPSVTAPLTLEALFKVTGEKSYMGLSYGNGQDIYFGMGVSDKRYPILIERLGRNFDNVQGEEGSLFLNDVVRISATIDENGNTQLYCNGELVGVGSTSHDISGRNTLSMGALGEYDNQFSGADVRVWSTVRTASEIQSDMMRVADQNDPNLIANYLFDEQAGGYAANSSSSSAPRADFFNSPEWIAIFEIQSGGWVSSFPYPAMHSMQALPPGNLNRYSRPNPGAIQVSGMTSVLSGAPCIAVGSFDQIDGSGANGTPTGGVSDPALMGVIAGTVLDIQAQPVSRRVRVHERATGRIVRETWSDADGKYRFTDLDPRRAFYVMAFDHTLQQNAVVSDNVHSEVEDSP
ncbi:LamG-like jellyroll fold domain-containing protein [Cobetia sp. MC34]|uniref:LamG-like jellyroll fold domain-containing protein n=1 Tax=Cobetia sp. MC34 TaxID=2785080 RepID=UPI001BC8EF93|nr:LamG-like jellyroll fold domain-containing protein [Cobetia sp. MC34]MBS4154962.1 hypothetical protein [Cobetia sp. MC34]